MLQVGLSEADVARAAQAAETDALRQAALDPGARAVERPPLQRTLPLAHGLDGLVSALTPKRQRARCRLGAGAQRAARAGAAGGLRMKRVSAVDGYKRKCGPVRGYQSG